MLDKENLAMLLIETADRLKYYDENYESKPLNESMLDPVNKTRCREIFDERDIMKHEVVKFIKSSFELWYKQLNPDMKIFDVDHYAAIGSSTGFQYTDTSDVDIQAIVVMKDGHDFSEMRKLINILPNGNNLPGTKHPVNYFFVDINNPTDFDKVENFYNIKTQTWEKKQEAGTNNVPLLYVREISRLFTDALDLVMGRFDRDLQYLKDSLKYNPETQDISENEKNEAVDKCVTQLKSDIDSMRLADKLIHGFRLETYDDKNFFHISINYMDDNDPRKSMNEAIYKTLDKFQYREKLWEKINMGKELLEELDSNGLI